MKITREYLRSIIKEEVFKLKEIDSTIIPGSDADKELTKAAKDTYNVPDTEVSKVKDIESSLLPAANNNNMSPEDLAKFAVAKGLNGTNPTIQAMNNSDSIKNINASDRNNPKTKFALAIKQIANKK